MTAQQLWDSVVENYDEAGLVQLTNPREKAESVNAVFGLSAAQEVVDLWPVYAQIEFDITNGAHLAVARHWVIATLFNRGGTSVSIAKVQWDDVTSPEGMLAKVRRTSPRGHKGPTTNSGTKTSSELANGRRIRGWSDRKSYPPQALPLRRPVDDDSNG